MWISRHRAKLKFKPMQAHPRCAGLGWRLCMCKGAVGTVFAPAVKSGEVMSSRSEPERISSRSVVAGPSSLWNSHIFVFFIFAVRMERPWMHMSLAALTYRLKALWEQLVMMQLPSFLRCCPPSESRVSKASDRGSVRSDADRRPLV